MSDVEYAAHCETCDAFAVSTSGTDWTQAQLTELARTHVRKCRAEEIDVVERSDDEETVIETVTPGVRAQ